MLWCLGREVGREGKEGWEEGRRIVSEGISMGPEVRRLVSEGRSIFPEGISMGSDGRRIVSEDESKGLLWTKESRRTDRDGVRDVMSGRRWAGH